MPRDVFYVREWTQDRIRYRLEFIPASGSPLDEEATEIAIPADVILAESTTEGGYQGDLPIGIPDATTFTLKVDLRACDQSAEMQDFRSYLTAPINGAVTLDLGGEDTRAQELRNVLTLYRITQESPLAAQVEFQGVQRELPGDEYGGDNAAQPNAPVVAEFVFTHIVHHILSEVRPADVATYALNEATTYGEHYYVCNLAVYRPAGESETAKSEGHYQSGLAQQATLHKLQDLYDHIGYIARQTHLALLRHGNPQSPQGFFLRGIDEISANPEQVLATYPTLAGTPHGVRVYHEQTYALAGTRGDALSTDDLYIIGEVGIVEGDEYEIEGVTTIGGFYAEEDDYSIYAYETVLDLLRQESEACGAKGVITFPIHDATVYVDARYRADLWLLPYQDNPGETAYETLTRRDVAGSTWKALQNAALLRGASMSLESAGGDDANEGTVRAHAAISETDFGLAPCFHNVPYLGDDRREQGDSVFRTDVEFDTDIFRATKTGFQTRGIYYLDAAEVSGVHLTSSDGMGGYYAKPFMVHHEFGTYVKQSEAAVYYEPGYSFLPFKVDSVSNGYLPLQINAMQAESTALIHAPAFYYTQFADSTQNVVTYELDVPYEVIQPLKLGHRYQFETPSGNFFLHTGTWLAHLSGYPWVISCSADHTTGMVTVTLYSRE